MSAEVFMKELPGFKILSFHVCSLLHGRDDSVLAEIWEPFEHNGDKD